MSQRESRYVTVAKIAYGLTKQSLPKYSHAKSPHHFELPQLAACVLLMFYLDLSYRDMEEWLLASDQVVKALALPRIPDHTTLQRTYKKLRKLDFEKMKNQLLEAENIQEDVIASDSTGFSPGQASLYYQTRTGRTYQHWLKGVYAIGTTSQYILAWQSGIGPSGDMAHLRALQKGSARYGTRDKNKRSWLMLADSGFDGQHVNDLDIIPPIRKHGKLVDPTRKARADLVSQARLDGLYGQRWKTETVISVIKRKFGHTIRSRRKSLQSREPIIKGLVYNIHL